jgi:hypothetical protein
MKFRALKPEEIEVRVATINEKGASLLLYKDARCDMNMLDEADVTWKREHQLINGSLFCTVSVWSDDIKDWVSRQDVGTESYTEKEKGQASDSFKRACFNWGIGRELYTAPFIWVSASKIEIKKSSFNGKDKYSTYDKFKVAKIVYNDNKEITALAIKKDKTSDVVYLYNNTGDK